MMRRCARLVRSARSLVLLIVALAAASVLVAPAADAATTGAITGLTATGGYDSVRLTWNAPVPRTAYRGVTIWRYEGNRSDNPPHVLVATLDRTSTSYVDDGLTVPSTRLWAYDVFTRDAAAGPIDPQYASDFLTSAMSGRVTDAQGNGLGGVRVVVGYTAWSSDVTTMTAADGTWFADGLSRQSEVACFDPGDTATGGVSTTGYQPECYDNVPSVPYYDSPNGQPQRLTVGAVTSGIDAQLAPGGAVTGVFRDHRGHRLANVVVTAVRDDSRVDRRLTTGPDGSYRVVGLAPGRYYVCGFEVHPGTAVSPASPFGFLETCAGNTEPGADQSIDVATGAATALDITLADGGAITGVLLGPDGKPVVGEYPQRNGTFQSDSSTIPTDANGRYTIKGLTAGSFTVCFRGTASSGTGDSFDPGRVARCWKSAAPSSPTPVAVSLGRVTGNISVRQEANPTIEGTVVDPQGRALRLVAVVADGVDTLTDADGRYRLGVTPGSHRVCFDAQAAVGPSLSGYVDRCWGTDASGGGQPTPVHVARGARVTGIDATLAVAAGVRVTVVNARGTPLKDALVELFSAHGGSYESARTNVRGVVIFTRVDLSAADYVASFDPSLWPATPPAPYGYRQSQVNVRVKPGLVNATLVAVSNGMLAGTVYGPAGQPVENASVEVSGGGGQVTTDPTSADGTYEANGLAPGTYTVCFSGYVEDSGTNRAVAGCYDRTTEATATPVQVPDGTAVTGIDGHLVFS